jgi:protein TonB
MQMLAYAANMPRAAGRDRSPQALTLIIAGHAVVLAGVLTAKPELIGIQPEKPPIVINIPEEQPKPKPQPAIDKQQPVTHDSFIPKERPIIDMDRLVPSIPLDDGPTIDDIGKVIGTGPTIVPDPPKHIPVMTGPRLATSESALKPPYPLDMRRLEKEATLRLKLTIDAKGHVIAVDPVGEANPSFLEAARRHIIKSWRYKPAMEDGVGIPSSTVISLSFRLEDV